MSTTIKKDLMQLFEKMKQDDCYFDETRMAILRSISSSVGTTRDTEKKREYIQKAKKEKLAFAIYKIRLLDFAKKHSKTWFDQAYTIHLLTNPIANNSTTNAIPLTSFDFDNEKLMNRLMKKQNFDEYCLVDAQKNKDYAKTMLMVDKTKKDFSEEEKAVLFEQASLLRSAVFTCLNIKDLTRQDLVTTFNYYYSKYQIINNIDTVDLQYLPIFEQLPIIQDFVITCDEVFKKDASAKVNDQVNKYCDLFFEKYQKNQHNQESVNI